MIREINIKDIDFMVEVEKPVYKEIPKKYLWDNALLGVYHLWVDPKFRRQGIASSLKN